MPCMAQKPEAILEFKQIGSTVRVTAVDPVTGIEAVILGPVTAGQPALRETALKKLSFLLGKQ
jgi:hypothetical protein